MPVRLTLGDVVLLYPSSYGDKQSIGLIKYIGSIRSTSCDITKQYVGIELSEPLENGHDGQIEGYQYFQCKKYYGIHVPITNVLRILKPSEIMFELQDVIAIFKTNLAKYIRALNERDSYLNHLCQKQKKLETLVATLSPNSPNQLNILHQTTAPLTPIADSNTIREMERRQRRENHETLTQMMDKVDNVITSQSLAIKLNAKQVGFDKYDRYTPMSRTQTPMDFSPNTVDSGTPSSYTPAPNPKSASNIHANKQNTPSSSHLSKQTMIVHNTSSTKSSTITTDGDEPDPLLPPSMDPIAETHSSRTQNQRNCDLPIFNNDELRQNMSHNTLDTRSPSQPHLLNTDTNLSTLSPHSPGPEYDDMNSTSSYFSAGSSAYNTPKSLTANAHCLLTSYNYNRKLSKSNASRPRNSSKSQKEIYKRNSRSHSKNKKRNSSHSHSKTKNVPHIASGTNTPTFNAANDEMVFNEDEYEETHNTKKRKKKRRKSKDPKAPQAATKKKKESLSTPAQQQRTNRSASAQFTPHSFHTIHEERIAVENNDDDLPVESPRFNGHHSTPIFTAQQHMAFEQNKHRIEDDDDVLTPELPHHAIQQYQDMPPFNLHYKSENVHFNNNARYTDNKRHEAQQRRSLPPNTVHGAQHHAHMTATTPNTITVPQFNYAAAKQQAARQRFTGSLRNIHEQNKMIYPQAQNVAQLDHWVEAPPRSPYEQHDMELMEVDIVEHIVEQPRFHKAKSMPAKPRFPSRQSIDMNPYIDQQFIFQPQTSPNNGPHAIYPNGAHYTAAPHNGYYCTPNTGTNTTNSSATSLHTNSHSPILAQQQHHSPVMLAHSPLPQSIAAHSTQLRPPAIITNNMNAKQIISNKIGTVKFAPRKSVSKMLRRKSKNDPHAKRRKSYQRQQQMLNQNNRQCMNQTQQKQMMAHNTYQHNHNNMPQINMSGFEMTDAMYD